MVLFLGPVGLVGAADDVGAVIGAAENDVRATLLVAELADAAGRSLTLDRDTDHDMVTNLEESLVDGAVSTGSMVFASIESKDFQDVGGKSRVGLTEAQIIVNSGEVAEDGGRRCRSGEIEWKREDATNGGDRTRNIGAVDGAGVPGVGGGLSDAVEHELGRYCAIGRVNGDGLVEHFEEAFDGESFVVAT